MKKLEILRNIFATLALIYRIGLALLLLSTMQIYSVELSIEV